MKLIFKEQSNIVESLENNNVIVDAVAGSGKTTTCLYIAKKFANTNILLNSLKQIYINLGIGKIFPIMNLLF